MGCGGAGVGSGGVVVVQIVVVGVCVAIRSGTDPATSKEGGGVDMTLDAVVEILQRHR